MKFPFLFALPHSPIFKTFAWAGRQCCSISRLLVSDRRVSQSAIWAADALGARASSRLQCRPSAWVDAPPLPVSSLLASTVLALCLNAALVPASAQRDSKVDYYRAPATVRGKMVVIPIGTILEGRIDSTIGSSVSKPGQQFTVVMSAPVLANGVDVILPSGTLVLGEVVEAIPHDRVPKIHKKHKPNGKLRVQLHGLRTPDGVSYPLVASIAPEESLRGNRRYGEPMRGTGVAYVGSSSSFEAVSPGAQARYRRQRQGAPQVVSRQDALSDPIFGHDRMGRYSRFDDESGGLGVRSLVRKGRDLYIYQGSPLSVRIDAPFRIGFSPQQYSPVGTPALPPPSQFEGTGKRFSKFKSQPPANEGPNDDPTASVAPPPQQGQIMPPAAPPRDQAGDPSF